MTDVPYRVGVVSVACVCLFFFSITDFIRRLTAAISLYGGRGTCVRRPWYARVAAAVYRCFWGKEMNVTTELFAFFVLDKVVFSLFKNRCVLCCMHYNLYILIWLYDKICIKQNSIFCEFDEIVYICNNYRNALQMLVTFNERYLEDLYRRGSTNDKRHRYQPHVVRGYQKAIKLLIQAGCKEDLYPFHSLNFEALHGKKEGLFSVRANGKYRVEFTIDETASAFIVSVCNVLELSNHYK